MSPGTTRRKLVQHGPSSLIVSLPARWVRLNSLQKGDEVILEERAKTLTLSVDTMPAQLSLTQDVSDLPPFLVTRFLARSYQKGYDELRLIHNNPELLRCIQEKVQELIGYEMIEQDDKSCLIRSITTHIDLNFDNSLRKGFLIIRDMLDTAVHAYAGGDRKTLQNLYLRDFEVNRLCYFCLRFMNKHGNTDPAQAHQTHVQYYLIEILEDLGDDVKKLAAELAKVPRTHPVIAQLLEMMQKQMDLSYEYYYKPTREKATEAYNLYKEMEAKVEQLAGDKLKKEEFLALMWLKESADVIYHFTTMRLDFLH